MTRTMVSLRWVDADFSNTVEHNLGLPRVGFFQLVTRVELCEFLDGIRAVPISYSRRGVRPHSTCAAHGPSDTIVASIARPLGYSKILLQEVRKTPAHHGVFICGWRQKGRGRSR